MAHEIETFDDGTAAFFTARTDAWHRLGTVTTDCLTAEQVMDTARLGGWNVRTVPLTASDMTENGVTSIPIGDHFATVRTHPISGNPDVLGVVGAGYTVVQNEEHTELLNLLVDEAGAHFETAGSLRGGRETFVTMKLPHTVMLQGSNGRDDVELYLAAMSSHDGTAAWRVIVTPIRIVCANTQRMALRSAKATYAIRHTKTAKAKIAQARQALGIVWRYADAFETEAQQLINSTLVLDEFQAIVDKLWPTDPTDVPSPRAAGIRDRRNTTLRGLFTDADTQHNVRGTRWAGLQAITEYLDHRPGPRRRHPRRPGAHFPCARRAQAAGLRPAVGTMTGTLSVDPFSVKAALTPDRGPRHDVTLRRSRRRVVENDDYAAFTHRILAAHARRIGHGDIEGLPALADLAAQVDTALHTAVTGLRAAGYSWADITARLGTTRQAAQQRFGAASRDGETDR